DVVEGGPGLGPVLEGEIPEGNDGSVHGQDSSLKESKKKGGRALPCPRCASAPERLAAQAFRRAMCREKGAYSLSSEPFLAMVLQKAATSRPPTMTAVRLLTMAAKAP